MDLGRAIGSTDRSRVVGWRAWTVVETKDGVRLASVIYDTVWSAPGPVTAECECGQAHVAPATACTCGFYAARDPVDALTYLRGRDEPNTLCRVLGEVVLSGVVVETEAGYRGATARPLRLYADDPQVAALLEATYRVPVLSPGCESGSATSSTAASAGLPTSSWNAARTLSPWTVASG